VLILEERSSAFETIKNEVPLVCAIAVAVVTIVLQQGLNFPLKFDLSDFLSISFCQGNSGHQ
jgi:lipoate-protein ligase B